MSKQRLQLSDRFTYGGLLRFTWPSMMMMLITSIYGVVDGVMVSNFVGTTPFAALNLIWPFVAILGSIGFMIGTGGSALVAQTLGMGLEKRARSIFSMLTYSALLISAILGIVGVILVEDVAVMLGAEGEMLSDCVEYGCILLYALPACMMQIYFQSLLVTAERPKMGMWVTISAGLMNVALDLLFIGVLHWGLVGAAWATVASQIVGGIIPLGFFALRRTGLRLGGCTLQLRELGRACYNGLSEFVMQISLSIVSMLYMYQLLREAGENGVAAYGIMMYFAFVFVAILIGYGMGSAPIISYHYGAGDGAEIKSLLRKSLTIISVLGILIATAAEALAKPLCAFFVGYDMVLLSLTVHAFRIYSLMFLVTGFNIFASAFFTALGNGAVSAFISILRTIGLEALCVILLPILFGIEGIWWSVSVAESIATIVSLIFIYRYRLRYGYA